MPRSMVLLLVAQFSPSEVQENRHHLRVWLLALFLSLGWGYKRRVFKFNQLSQGAGRKGYQWG